MPGLREAIAAMPDTRLIIIDPVSAYCDKVDSHKNSDVRGLLGPLATLASETGVALVCVTHLNKSPGRKALYRATGSLAYIAAARAAWLVVADTENPRGRLMLPSKMNVAEPSLDVAYTIESEHVAGAGPVGCVYWSHDPVDITADKALAAELKDEDDDDKAPARNEAAEWLKQELALSPVAVTEIRKQSRAAGMSWRTVRRAKESLGIRSSKGDFDGGWAWKLDRREDGHVTRRVATLGERGHLGILDRETRFFRRPKMANRTKVAMFTTLDTLASLGTNQTTTDHQWANHMRRLTLNCLATNRTPGPMRGQGFEAWLTQ